MMLKLKLQYFGHLMRRVTHWKRLWCWKGLGAGEEGVDREWDGWIASLTQWTWVWVNSSSWWWTGKPGVLRFMGSQRVGHDWATELNWGLNSKHMLLLVYTWSDFSFLCSPAGNYKSMLLVNTDISILNKLWQTRFSSILKGLHSITKWDVSQEFKSV